MRRLRVRIEVDRRGQSFPVEALADFVSAINLFLAAVSNDLGLDLSTGNWNASDFDRSSFSFTAEFSVFVESDRVSAFHSGIQGSSSLSLAVSAHLASLASTILDDHAVGFGLFGSDNDDEPAEWLAMSRRRALDVWQQIKAVQSAQASAVALLKELLQPAKPGTFGRKIEPVKSEPVAADDLQAFTERLSTRVATVEGTVGTVQSRVGTLENKVAGIEQNLKKMIEQIDQFCRSVGARFGTEAPDTRELFREPVPPPRSSGKWMAGLLILLVLVPAVWILLRWPSRSPTPVLQPQKQQASPVPPPAPPTETKAQAPPAETGVEEKASPLETTASQPIEVSLRAENPSWMVVFEDGKKTVSRLLDTDQEASFHANDELRIRLGNAGGVQVTWNGKGIGAGGRSGQVRLLRFTRTGHESLPVRFPIQD